MYVNTRGLLLTPNSRANPLNSSNLGNRSLTRSKIAIPDSPDSAPSPATPALFSCPSQLVIFSIFSETFEEVLFLASAVAVWSGAGCVLCPTVGPGREQRIPPRPTVARTGGRSNNWPHRTRTLILATDSPGCLNEQRTHRQTQN